MASKRGTESITDGDNDKVQGRKEQLGFGSEAKRKECPDDEESL